MGDTSALPLAELPAIVAGDIHTIDHQLEEELNQLLSAESASSEPDLINVLGELHMPHQQHITTDSLDVSRGGLPFLSSTPDLANLFCTPTISLLPSLPDLSTLLRVPSNRSYGDGCLSDSSSLVSPMLLDTFSFEFPDATLPAVSGANTVIVDTSSESDLASSTGSPVSSWPGLLSCPTSICVGSRR